MNNTWNFVWNRLYCPGTGMFYNHLVGDEPDAATRYLPEPEMIQHLVPNPAGYGTGLEDCMMNAGIMMDAVISRYEAEKDASMRDYASGIYSGMELGATVSPKEGFLPRGVSPADRKSHYIDTSRDQYTNWFFGAFRFYFSPLSDDKQKESIRRCLTAMAKKFEREVIPQNGYSFLREDGKCGLVGGMWGEIGAHEYLRLPMLYLLTYQTTGDEYWYRAYMKYRDEAIEKTLAFVPLHGATYVGLQLQYSLRMVHDLDGDHEVRRTLCAFMHKMAAPYEKKACETADYLMTEKGREWLAIEYIPWQNAKARFAGFIGGIGYYTPEPSDFREHQSYYPLRAVGEGITVAALCPDYRVPDEVFQKLCDMAAFVDYSKHRTCAPIALLDAYWRVMSRRTAQ